MRKTFIPALCLLLLSSCSARPAAPERCAARQPFAGKTCDDLVAYAGTLERLYDECYNRQKALADAK